MTDKEIVEALIRHDERVTAQFFYRDCRALFLSVIRRVFGTQVVDYDEISANCTSCSWRTEPSG